jgi:hypothetical protein
VLTLQEKIDLAIRCLRDKGRPAQSNVLVALDVLEDRDTCTCPKHGTWIAARDISAGVRLLDMRMNGDAAAKDPRLADILPQLIDHIEKAKLYDTLPNKEK